MGGFRSIEVAEAEIKGEEQLSGTVSTPTELTSSLRMWPNVFRSLTPRPMAAPVVFLLLCSSSIFLSFLLRRSWRTRSSLFGVLDDGSSVVHLGKGSS